MRRNAFTLVEMLVVIGVIVILLALLIPAAGNAISSARNATMSIEIGELAKGIERYKQEKGDYPPSMAEIDCYDLDGDNNVTESMYQPNLVMLSVAEKHLRKCYPKMTTQEKQFFYTSIAPNLTPDEALVFWLALTQNDERNPFSSSARNFKTYFPFKEERLIDYDGDTFPSYKPGYAKESPFAYFDARHYLSHQYEDPVSEPQPPQPYGDYKKAQAAKTLPAPANLAEANARKQAQFINPGTFQIVCAGQDGDFGKTWTYFDAQGYPREDFSVQPPQGLRMFREGTMYSYDDLDNLTNFSDGKTLGSARP